MSANSVHAVSVAEPATVRCSRGHEWEVPPPWTGGGGQNTIQLCFPGQPDSPRFCLRCIAELLATLPVGTVEAT